MAMKWSAILVGMVCILSGFPALADVVGDAPEAADYMQVLELDIPDVAAFNSEPVVYKNDFSDTVDFDFDRVAYHLELEEPGGARFFVYVSFPSHVLSAAKIGVPHVGTGVFVQKLLEDVHVVSNHPDLEGLSTLDTGVMEFWPSNYMTDNSLGVSGASGSLYDFGDQPATGAGYGSMQIHDYATGQTLFAYNHWGPGTAEGDLGMGNQPGWSEGGLNADWTFAGNASSYKKKKLRVLVREGGTPQGLSLSLMSPDPHQVVQRQDGNTGTIPVAGLLLVPCDTLEGRLVPLDPTGAVAGEPGPWSVVDGSPSGSSFSGSLSAMGGWYRMEMQVSLEGEVIDTLAVEPVGIGEVFVIAGQSNSANHGESPTTPQDARVSAWGEGGWQFGADPQPVATGTGGSPWPALGDRLAERFNVPIGFLSVGWGGSAVDQWRPFSPAGFYSRLLLAMNEVGVHGARAILWHQGETDASMGTSQESYTSQFQEVISAIRADAGWEIPWGIARASFLPNLPPESMAEVVNGQNDVIAADPLNFAGAYTDDMLGDEWRYDGVHFNLMGLEEHAKRWDESIFMPECVGLIPNEECAPDEEPDAVDSDTESGSDASVNTEDAAGNAEDAAGNAEDAGGTEEQDTSEESVEGDGSDEETISSEEGLDADPEGDGDEEESEDVSLAEGDGTSSEEESEEGTVGVDEGIGGTVLARAKSGDEGCRGTSGSFPGGAFFLGLLALGLCVSSSRRRCS